MKVLAAIAKALKDNGVDTMFGLIGDANLYVVDSFVREHGGSFVSSSHESGGAVMALGYAVTSGKLGVATVTQGPALTNTLTALVEGVKGRTPMLLVAGDTAAEDREHSQDIPHRDVVLPTGAGFEQVRSASSVVEDTVIAMRRAFTERRPIVLNVPIDYQWTQIDYAPIPLKLAECRAFVPASADLDDAVGIIAAAKRPIILAGRGATDAKARAALIRLAKRTDALLATTLKAKDLFKGEDFNLGIMGSLSTPVAVDLILQSDCIVAFGASLNRYTTSQRSFVTGKRIVQCDLNVEELGRITRPTVGLVGDAALMADLMVHWLDQAEIPQSGFRTDAIRRQLAEYSPTTDFDDLSTETTIDIRKALARINDVVPPDRHFVADGGRFMNSAFKLIGTLGPDHFISGLNFGSIGLGMSYAIGASKAAPNRPVLLVTGDGGFMHGGIAEFNTAVRFNLDLIVVLCNDGGYGAEYVQFRGRDLDPGLSLFAWPDFAPVATALGGHGLTVRTAADLERAVAAIKSRDRPLLIDLKLRPDHVP